MIPNKLSIGLPPLQNNTPPKNIPSKRAFFEKALFLFHCLAKYSQQRSFLTQFAESLATLPV